MPLYISSTADTSLFTGSSFEDHANYNSSKCISRYGAQDMVGNLWEPTDTVLNCDYSLDKMYFGFNTATELVTEMGGSGDRSKSVPLTQDTDIYTWVNAPIKNINGDINSEQTGNKSWVSIDANSGYCSIADTDSTRTSPLLFKDVDGYFKNIFKADGTKDDAVVPFSNPISQSSVDYMRNGDAFFLNFGPGMMGAPMRLSNTMALSIGHGGITPPDGTLLSNYFNPWTGLSLTLDNYNDPNDNKLITTSNFSSKTGYDPTGITVTNFPVGNSQISNVGIADFQYLNAQTNSGIYRYTFGPGSENTDISVRMSFTLNGAGNDYTSHTFVSRTIPSLYGTEYFDGDFIDLYNPRFDVPRGSNLVMLLGGGYDVSWSGRYSMKSRVQSENFDRSSAITGIRCGILINTED
jgi:hypothetical protein